MPENENAKNLKEIHDFGKAPVIRGRKRSPPSRQTLANGVREK